MSQRPVRLHEMWAPWAPFMALYDAACAGGSGLLSLWLIGILNPELRYFWPPPDAFRVVISVAAIATPFVLHAADVYRPMRGQSLKHEVGRIFLCWSGLFLAFSAFAFFSKTGTVFSRLWMGCWFLMGLVGLATARVILRKILREIRRRGLDLKDLVLVGGGEMGRHIQTNLSANPWTGFKVAGYFDDRTRDSLDPSAPRIGSFADLPGYLDTHRVDQVWITLPLSAETKIKSTLDELKYRSVDVRLVPDVRSYQLLNHSVETIAGMTVLNLSASPHVGLDRMLKRSFDIIGASLALLIFAPLMLLVALAVWLDSGRPIIFTQLRHGWDGKPFRVLKFRSMRTASASTETTYEQAKRDDPRITRIGTWIRKLNLDEMPQLINILLGDMSLVGPRPHPIEMNRLYQNQVDRYMLRHRVRPGITGWAQINGYRGETDTLEKMQGRIDHDLYYIEHWSISLDVRILLLTLIRSFRDPNAY